MKTLVAYFSASGTTKKLAQELSKLVKADLFEIKPSEPYSARDLDWTDSNSRSSLEMKSALCRPAISNKIEDINAYDVIFVGFPIWWYVAPKIINTFLESYDLSGKTIVPFATSGGSGMGKTNDALKNSCKGATLLNGKVINNASNADIKNWIKSLKLNLI